VQERRRVVAAVGIRHGKQVEAIRLFLEAGYLVAAFDPVALHFDPLDDEERVPFDELTASWPTRFAFIEHPFGESPYLFVSSEELAPGLLAAADARFGKTEVVYLGPGWGGNITSGGDFIAGLAERGGGEFIATEADPPADQVLRWVAEWSAQPWASTVECVTLREPSTGGPSSGRPPADAGESSWRVLTAAGWDGPLSVADADRIARARVADGSDLLAGRLWRYVGTGDVDSGRCAVGDADAMAEARGADGDLPDGLDPSGRVATAIHPRYLVFWIPGGDWPFGVEVTPVEGPVEAVRVSIDAEAFDFPDPYEEIGAIEVPSGRMVASDPMYLGTDVEIALDVPPGRWIVEQIVPGELEGIRLRRTSAVIASNPGVPEREP